MTTPGYPVSSGLGRYLSRLVVAPSFLCVLVFVYGFIAWTGYVSLTNSGMLPRYEFAGLVQYHRLWESARWGTAVHNLAIYASAFIVLCLALGLALALLLDQQVRAEGLLRSIFLYPMALSFIVTGVAWKWVLNPGLGIEHSVRGLGWTDFTFDWLVNSDKAIYTIVIAAVWQSSGFVMALFLAGLRGVDAEIVKAARLEGAGMARIYWRIILPTLRPVFLSAVVVLAHIAVKTYDLVVAMTGGGPGFATDLPSTFMTAHTFLRNQTGLGAASAMMILFTVSAIIVPYLYSEMRGTSHG